MLISESFRKKNPNEISSEQIFGESISNINYVSSVNNNYMSVEKKIGDFNFHDISNLKNNTSSMMKQKDPSDVSYTGDSRHQHDNKLYNYSESENTRTLGSPNESNLKKIVTLGTPTSETTKGKSRTSLTTDNILSNSMKSSLIHENQQETMKKLIKFSGKGNEKGKMGIRSRSKSRSRMTNENLKKVEVIMEVDQEYREKSSLWSQTSIMKDGESIRELAKKKGVEVEELGLRSRQLSDNSARRQK